MLSLVDKNIVWLKGRARLNLAHLVLFTWAADQSAVAIGKPCKTGLTLIAVQTIGMLIPLLILAVIAAHPVVLVQGTVPAAFFETSINIFTASSLSASGGLL